MRRAWIVLAACGVVPARSEPIERSGPCGILDAIYASDDPSYRHLVGGSDMHHPLTFEVRAPAELFPASTKCEGRPYRIFHGEPDVRGMIVLVDVGASGAMFISLDDPNGTPNPEGGWDVATCYCHVGGLAVEREGGHWRVVSKPQW